MKVKCIIYKLFLALMLFTNCKQHPHEENEGKINEVDNYRSSFKAFLNKFKVIKLPYYFSDNNDNISGLNTLDEGSADTLFIKPEGGSCYCQGILPDTSKYYAVIVLFPADSYYPMLYTFSKAGKKISKEFLLVAGCGPGPEVVYCNSTTTIYKNNSIYSADSATLLDVDSTGAPIKNTEDSTVRFKKGYISKSGKVIISGIENISLARRNQHL